MPVTRPPAKVFRDPEELDRLVNAYFEDCEKSKDERELKNGDVRIRQKTPTMIGLAVWLGVNKQSIYYYLNGERDDCEYFSEEERNKIISTLSRARDRIEAALVARAVDGDCDSRTAALLLNSYGYSAKVETDATVRVTVDGSSEEAEKWSQ